MFDRYFVIKLVANKSKILADHVEQIVKLVTATQNVTIECNNSIKELESPDNLTNKTDSANKTNKKIKLYDIVLFNNQRMQSSDRITLDEKENTITITNTSSKDAGIYFCLTDYDIKKWDEKSNKWMNEKFTYTKTAALYVFSMISLFK